MNMDYTMEELLPVVEKLTFQFTSGDSSSVTYETARMLMEAILYCIEEYEKEGNEFGVRSESRQEAAYVYKLGYEAVREKVYKAKELYEIILKDFKDYGLRNLKETFLDGMPAFFIRYDPKFKPQDHLLTLDYPTVGVITNLKGIDAIYQYLCNIKLENDFLQVFAPENIARRLERLMPDYKEAYYDNICDAVLLTIIGCYIADKSIGQLDLGDEDMIAVQGYFEGNEIEIVEGKIQHILAVLFQQVFSGNEEMKAYFMQSSRNYAVRIMNGIQNNSLSGVFGLYHQFG
jgi:hypothetical protein